MISRNGGLISIPDIFVMGRHDFNTGFIKHILNILVQKGICILLYNWHRGYMH